jgi:aldehyde dehydrogenase (NAD+)
MTTTVTPSVSGEARMLIDGKLVEAGSGRLFDNVNPATEEVLGQVADGSADDMAQAIGAARRAFDETTWSTDKALRKRCLEQLQAALVSEQELLRNELVAEVGTPILLTYGPQLDAPLEDGLLWPAEMIDRFEWERELPIGTAFGMTSWRRVVKEAAGVVGAIIPWNFPFEVMLQKVGQALATGNTLIVKPAPDTPWNATRLGRLVAEQTDIPPGVVNVVTSSDHLVGEVLTLDPRVDVISFTGSTVTGQRIMEKGAKSMKRLFLELGGKSAHIVLDDANLAATVPGAAFVCVHAGQGCAMLTRLLVPRDRLDESVDLVKDGFATVTFGDPTDPGVLHGPQISQKQRERVLGYIDRGVAEGAELVLGGGRPAQFPKGWYVEPTLMVDTTASTSVSKEEIFGPVLVVIPFDDDDDAVRIANDTEYGLSGMVTSGSEERAIAVARRIRSGTVGVNGGVFYGADAPFGGYKASGFGRQNGLEGFEQYLETKTISGPAPSDGSSSGSIFSAG